MTDPPEPHFQRQPARKNEIYDQLNGLCIHQDGSGGHGNVNTLMWKQSLRSNLCQTAEQSRGELLSCARLDNDIWKVGVRSHAVRSGL